MFALTANGSLGLCCPGDRVVTLQDNPYSLLRDESRRADKAEARADALAAEVAEIRRRLSELDPDRPT